MLKWILIVGYLAIIAAVGLLARRRSRAGVEDFFLAGRALGPVMLLLTMAATNFSAFTVFGFAGAGYRIGYAYYPIMAFGTGFMALSFLFIGVPIWRAAKKLGAITPPELIGLRFQNRWLHLAYLVVMVVFTLPYLALQPMGAGYALSGLLGIPYPWGATGIVVIGVAYVLWAGMRGDAWTDALQGLVMLVGLAVVFFGLAAGLGGFASANRQVFAQAPELFGRPGGGAVFTVGIWFSYMALWMLCVPVFPQLFQRFMAASGPAALGRAALFYPIVTGVLFFFPVSVGVMGRLLVPGLEGAASDRILPLAVAKGLPDWVGAVAIGAAIAALMSTMDSQLLVLGSMVTRDTAILTRRPGSARWESKGLLFERLAIVALALVGLVLALRPLATLLEIATQTFTGLAVLFPVTLAAVYWRRANPWAGLASIIFGEALVVLYYFKLVPAFGLLPAIPVTACSAFVLVLGSLIFPARDLEPLAALPKNIGRWIAAFGIVFLLSIDVWNRHDDQPWLLGLPAWMWYFFILTGILTSLIALFLRRNAVHVIPRERSDRGIAGSRGVTEEGSFRAVPSRDT